MGLQFHRYLKASEFASALDKLRVYRGEHVSTWLLESLEAERLLLPRVRVRYPDAIARGFWIATHEDWPRELIHPVEQEGPRWDSAVDFSNALHTWRNYIIYGLSDNPLDNPEPRFTEFITNPAKQPFQRWDDMRVDVSDAKTKLFDDTNFESYYSTWQLLLAAEVADAGVHMRLNLADEKTFQSAREALSAGRVPDGAVGSFNFIPIHAARDFAKHERALDAVVWFMEERARALNDIIKGQGGRFRLSQEQLARYEQATIDAATGAAKRFQVGIDELIALIRFLGERWSDWKRDGRPLLTDAYKDFAGAAVILIRRLGKFTFAETRDRVGKVSGWFKPILDVIWPNWAEEEKKRVSMTLKGALGADYAEIVADSDIEAFVEFLANEGLEAFFWRLKSFEDHALRGNEFAVEGMKSDLQGMAVAVEHIAAALGGTKTQLYEKFKELWRDPDVLGILKRGDVVPLYRQARLAADWPALKAKIDTLRSEKGGKIAADLVLAHRIRGGVHAILPEDDELELQALFLTLMRAAVFAFVEVRKTPSAETQILTAAEAFQP